MDFARLDHFLDFILDLGVPGADCIIKKGYETIYRRQVGYADQEARRLLQGDERMFLYSCTKPITCAGALQLYEQGKFLMTDPLYEYIPEYRYQTISTLSENGEECVRTAKNPITIGDLFAMTAGMDYNLNAPAIQTVRQKTNGRAPTLDVVRALASQPLHYEPGSHWSYSLAHDVLGGLIEVISGKRFGDFLREGIFEPLGMNSTSFTLPSEDSVPMMVQYWRDEETNVVSRIPLENEFVFGSEYESGGAGLISTAEDYILFAAAMSNGGIGENGAQILNRNTIDLMRSNRLGPQQQKDFNWVRFRGYGYGLGVRTMVDRASGGSNSSLGEFGWAGAAGSYVAMDPTLGISIFYGQHMRKNLEAYIHPRLRNIIYSCL